MKSQKAWWYARPALLLGLLLVTLTAAAETPQWRAIGPDGGDVRSLAYDPLNPDRVYLGTSAGRLYISNDHGASWARFAYLGGHDYVLDNIAIDPTGGTIYVAGWSVEDNNAGEVFRSTDGGKNWKTLKGVSGKSIRALAMAPSDPKALVIGALDGVFRTLDGGESWHRVSPANHPEIKNIESVAIDPRNPDIIYAGTWHLPWKTYDGGKTWKHIKQGVIDDSDVFSIIISRKDPQVVYISACSGIYKSENAGDLFRKAQGIPSSARRTRVLAQDPNQPDRVYAGTTEGLWRTDDAGRTWRRLTAANIIVNDVYIDPRDSRSVLVATDRSGVLASRDAGQTFSASNRGFAHRQVAAVLVDRQNPGTIYAGVINDKEFGGVFVSRDDGARWNQISFGLGGRDVFTLRQADDGTILAGTNRGIFVYDARSARWQPVNTVVQERTFTVKRKVPTKKGVKTVSEQKSRTEVGELEARVNQLELTPRRWYAATTAGLFWSDDAGRTWKGGKVMGETHFLSVAVNEKAGTPVVLAATPTRLVASLDGGTTWFTPKLPDHVTPLRGAALDQRSTFWIATRVGVFRSSDAGDKWQHESSPTGNFVAIHFDADSERMLAIDRKDNVFERTATVARWQRVAEPGWRLRGLGSGRGRLYAATAYDGIVAPPPVVVNRGTSGSGGSE